MKVTHILTAFLVSSLLVGCATTQRPDMPDGVYTNFGIAWLTFDRCAKEGLMPPETAALGHTYLGYNMHSYRFVPEIFNKRVNDIAQVRPAPQRDECVQAAMDVAKRQQQIESNRQANASNQQAYSRPVQTTCNRIGTQTFCNSY